MPRAIRAGDSGSRMELDVAYLQGVERGGAALSC